jgi:serine/threonine protein kinase
MPNRIEAGAEPIPGYRLISRIGGGGYGDVWKCEVPGGLAKAIKFVYGSLVPTDGVLDDFADDGRAVQEWKSLERVRGIRHPFILALDRYEVVDGQLLIVSELADCSLYDRLKECRKQGLPGIPRDELINYMLETAEALDYMTEKHDLLHLDIKPQNLFLLCNHVKIGDFGLVKEVEGKLANVTGGFTTLYAAPESFEGFVTRYSDQYSLAIVYQELLTGQRPFTGQTPKQLLMQHLNTDPMLDPLPEHDRQIIGRALAKKPTERWQRSMDMVRALTRAKEEFVRKNTVLFTRPDPLPVSREETEVAPRSSRDRTNQAAVAHTEPVSKLRSAHLKDLGFENLISPDGGVLRPVVLVGLGYWGRVALQFIDQALQEQFPGKEYPLISMLAVDTDPTLPAMPTTEYRVTEDFIHMPLSRPARYIRSKDDLPPVEGWIDSNVIYRMPRNLVTNGIRSFGRLAFIEHHAAFVTRLEKEVTRLLREERGILASELSGQRLRNREPLIYFITHLGGGTGSGMLVDAAMLAGKTLKTLSCGGEVGAILFSPDQRDEQPPDLPEANAVATLYELQFYQRIDSTFQAQYHVKEEPLLTSDPPFSHCLFVEMPSRPVPEQLRLKDPALGVIRKFAQSMTRLLVTALGQIGDPSWLAKTSPAAMQSFASFRITASRAKIIEQASSKICNQVLDHWLQELDSGHAKHVRAGVEEWIQQLKLGGKDLYATFDSAISRELGAKSDAYATKMLEPLSRPLKEYLPKPKEIDAALNSILETLGNNRPDESTTVSMLSPAIRVGRVIRVTMEHVIKTVSDAMHKAILRLVDLPNKRLGAAEEALRCYSRFLAKAIQKHSRDSQVYQQQFVEALGMLKGDLNEYERLRQTSRFLWPRMASPGQHLLAIYIQRYQALLHDRIVTLYTELGSRCTRTAQELRQLRIGLLDLRQRFRKLSDESFWELENENQQGQMLLVPPGYTTLLQVVQQLSDGISNSDVEKLDQELARELATDYPNLQEVSRGGADTLMPLRPVFLSVIAGYLGSQFPEGDVLSQMLEEQPSISQTIDMMHGQAELPVPLAETTSAFELVFLALPESPETERLHKELTLTYPDMVTVYTTQQEVVLHRAVLGMDITDLSVMNEASRLAYETAKGIENFTPHCRQDIEDWIGPPVTGLVGAEHAVSR